MTINSIYGKIVNFKEQGRNPLFSLYNGKSLFLVMGLRCFEN